jgi:hypothetical protein
MEDKDVSLDQLKNVYKAQTEAYLEFNMALINIVSNQKDIIAKVENLKLFSEDEMKSLSKEYYSLEKLFVNFQNTQLARDASLEKTNEDYEATISSFGAYFVKLKDDIDYLKKMFWEIRNAWNKGAWTIGGIVAFLTVVQLVSGKGLIDLFK